MAWAAGKIRPDKRARKAKVIANLLPAFRPKKPRLVILLNLTPSFVSILLLLQSFLFTPRPDAARLPKSRADAEIRQNDYLKQ